MPRILISLATVGLAAGIAHADPSDLEGGVFIAHHPAVLQYTSPAPPEGWCQHYLDNFAINDCQGQVNRIDTGDGVVWFVLCAWAESKEWCGTEFGFGDYDAEAFLFTGHGPCFPEAGLEIPMATWPGPNAGTSIVICGSPWSGNMVPVYFFAGYAYSTTVIGVGANPNTGRGGTGNCIAPPQVWPAATFGAMGLFTDGVFSCPAAACCIGADCHLVTENECQDLQGVWHPSWPNCDGEPCETGGPQPVVCCIGNSCYLLTPAECFALGGEVHSGWLFCDPNPCEPQTPVRSSSWGQVKWLYR